MSEIFSSTAFGFCWWDIPAAIVLVCLIAAFFIRRRALKKRIKELQDEAEAAAPAQEEKA